MVRSHWRRSRLFVAIASTVLATIRRRRQKVNFDFNATVWTGLNIYAHLTNRSAVVRVRIAVVRTVVVTTA